MKAVKIIAAVGLAVATGSAIAASPEDRTQKRLVNYGFAAPSVNASQIIVTQPADYEDPTNQRLAEWGFLPEKRNVVESGPADYPVAARGTGEIESYNDDGTVTLRHDLLPGLRMGRMTMTAILADDGAVRLPTDRDVAFVITAQESGDYVVERLYLNEY